MKTRRGDIVLILFPNSDLRTAKRRPALVLQRIHRQDRSAVAGLELLARPPPCLAVAVGEHVNWNIYPRPEPGNDEHVPARSLGRPDRSRRGGSDNGE